MWKLITTDGDDFANHSDGLCLDPIHNDDRGHRDGPSHDRVRVRGHTNPSFAKVVRVEINSRKRL